VRLLWAFFLRDLRIAASYRLQLFFQVAGVLSICVTFFFLSFMLRDVEAGIAELGKYGGSYFAFAILGIAVSSFVDLSLRSFSTSIRTAQMTGTFEAMLSTRASVAAVVAGSSLYTLLFTALRSALLVVLAGLLFGVPLHASALPAVLLIVGLTVLATLALGIFSAGFIVLFKQGDPLSNAISGLTFLLGGVIYPKEIMPDWVQRIADLLPVTHALEAMRLALLLGVPLSELQRSVIGLSVFAAIGLPLALLWFAWAVARARVAGSLARY